MIRPILTHAFNHYSVHFLRLLITLVGLLPVAVFAQYDQEVTLPEVDIEEKAISEESELAKYNYGEVPDASAIPPVQTRNISAEKWEKAVGNLDFSKDVPATGSRRSNQSQQQQNQGRSSGATSGGGSGTGQRQSERHFSDSADSPDIDVDTGFWGGFFKILTIALLLGLLGFIVYRFMQEPKNTAIARDGTAITMENLEQYIHETDLDRFLKAALAGGNYAQAVRVYFLQIIKDLSSKKAIVWSREKTNHTYLREMRAHPASNQFQGATAAYERVWYGNTPIGLKEYEPIARQMTQMLAAI